MNCLQTAGPADADMQDEEEFEEEEEEEPEDSTASHCCHGV